MDSRPDEPDDAAGRIALLGACLVVATLVAGVMLVAR